MRAKFGVLEQTQHISDMRSKFALKPHHDYLFYFFCQSLVFDNYNTVQHREKNKHTKIHVYSINLFIHQSSTIRVILDHFWATVSTTTHQEMR